jgi:16S rRNA U516 pseudouridylate synthase RsuA-like enzyme
VYVANQLPGELVTTSDPRGRPTLAGRLKKGKGLKGLIDRLKFVGRLDFNSEGLILLTNRCVLRREDDSYVVHPAPSCFAHAHAWRTPPTRDQLFFFTPSFLHPSSAELATRLEHPGSGLERRYRVRVHGTVPDWKLAAFGRGVTVDGVR